MVTGLYVPDAGLETKESEFAVPAALTMGMVDKIDGEHSNDLAAVNKQGGGRYG